MEMTKIIGLLALGLALGVGAATNEPPAKAVAAVKDPLAPPQTLKTAEGRPETGLVDPFVRRPLDAEGVSEDGLLRTGLGELSTEFRILAIVMPADTNQVPTALLQMNNQTEPVLVHPDDIVMVDRAVGASGTRTRAPRAVRRGAASAKTSTMEEKLKDYVFYLHVKSITANYLEVYHNKKRPEETILLNW